MRILLALAQTVCQVRAYTFLPYGSVCSSSTQLGADAARWSTDHTRIELTAETEGCLWPIDAGPFSSADEAADLLRRWLLEYWECHRIDDERNSCFAWGACHRRCWWRSSAGRVLLTFEHAVDAQAAGVQQKDSSALAYLAERSEADQSCRDPKALVLYGAVVSLEPGRHYAGLRPSGWAVRRCASAPRMEAADAAADFCTIQRAAHGKGLGAFATQPIARDEFVCSYEGECLTHAEVLERYLSRDGLQGAEYLFELPSTEERRFIDGACGSHPSRYLNHDENGSLRAILRPADGERGGEAARIELHAARDIAAGEELTFDYGTDFWVARESGPLASTDSRLSKIRTERLLRKLRPWLVALPACLPL